MFLTDITGLSQAWEVALPEPGDSPAWPDQRTFASERVMSIDVSPVAGSAGFIYGTDVGGNENLQLIFVDDTGSETVLTKDFPNAMHAPGQWSDDGSRLLFAANRRRADRFDLYLHHLHGPTECIFQHDQAGYLQDATFSPDGSRVAFIHHRSSFDQDVLEVDLRSGRSRLLTSASGGVRYTSFDYVDDRTIIALTDRDSNFLRLVEIDLQSLDTSPVIEAHWDIESMLLSKSKKTLLYSINDNGASRLIRRDLAAGTEVDAPLPETAVFLGADVSADDETVVVAYSTANHTADLYLWRFADLALAPVTRSSHGGVPTGEFVTPTPVAYPTFDTDASGSTRMIPGWYFPTHRAAASRAPAIVAVHGGPESQSRPAFNPLFQYFLHHGYALLVPNVRGSTGYGTSYAHLDDVEKRMDSVADLLHAVRWLMSRDDIDPDRIIVYGGSYGGFMVLSALTTYPAEWAAGVNIVGISSFITFLENTSGYRRAHREAEYGSLEKDREFLESISPINQIHRIRAPLFIIHGENDPRVPVSETRQLAKALTERSVPVELMVFDDEGHGLAKLKNKLAAYPAMIAFLDRVVKHGTEERTD
jgi:dipeptidyl aminopeptidase/acylaminoacyl peptidase